MKKIFLLIFILFTFMIVNKSFSQPHFGDIELLVFNASGSQIYIQLYPMGGLFNGYDDSQPSILTHYTLNSQFYVGGNTGVERRGSSVRIKNIVGLDGYALTDPIFTDHPGYFPISNNGDCIFGHDKTGSDLADGEIGYGKYILKIFKYIDPNMIPICDSIIIDWLDLNYGTGVPDQAPDLAIIVNGITSNSDITSFWNSSGTDDPRHVFDSSDTPGIIQVWRQFHRYDQVDNRWEGYNVPTVTNPPSRGTSISDANFLIYPLDGRNLPSPYTLPKHNFPGTLEGNVEIKNNVTTPGINEIIEFPTLMNIRNGAEFRIDTLNIFDMIEVVSSDTTKYFKMNVETNGVLFLELNAQLIVGNKNHLNLALNSKLYLGNGAIIDIRQGAHFCNYGASIRGNGHIVFKGGTISHVHCNQVADYLLKDSVKFILDSNAVLEIPDSTTLHFTGKETALIMKPGSKLKMGVGSKLLFDSSASIKANGGTFTSVDTALKWEGIFLSNTDIDSIVNCTFSNAKTALTITNTANNYYKNRVIKNNTFNIPSGGVHKGIYGENNYKILLQDNVFNMPVYNSQGQSPVLLEYIGVYLKNSSTIEAAGGDVEDNQATNYSLNIIHNTFTNGCASLILANYTSNYLPYIIVNNTFNHTASVNLIGIKISGRIRKNNFTSDDVPLGIHLVNSSPDLYKNTIVARDVGLHLAGHCYPVLAPYVSGSNSVWPGGNNIITTDSIDNIQLSSSGHVKTDLGNNNFNVENSSAYHIYGWLDSSYTVYYSRENCWNNYVTPRIYLKVYGAPDTIPEPYVTISSFDCTTERSSTGWNVSYQGNGIYDSIKKTTNNTGGQPRVEQIFFGLRQ